jgi:dihydroorotase
MKKMNNISIIGGRIIDTAQHIDKISDLHIADGRILSIGAPPANFQVDQVIDAKDKIVCAGLVDLAVRLREPGQEHKATIASETLAAAYNGITSLCCPPDTSPVVDTPAVAELLRQRAKNGGHCRIFPLAALTQGLEGKQLSEMSELKQVGCIGVSNAQVPIANTQVLKNAYEYAANCDLTVFIQPQEPYLGRGGCVHEGAISSRMGLAGIASTPSTNCISWST